MKEKIKNWENVVGGIKENNNKYNKIIEQKSNCNYNNII